MNFAKRSATLTALLAFCSLLLSCSGDDQQFSLRDGFSVLIEKRGSTLPTVAERALLELYRPELYLPLDHEGPINFYQDYIANGYLVSSTNSKPINPVTRAQLNAVKRDNTAIFTHTGANGTPQTVAYASVHHAKVDLPNLIGKDQQWTFLVYHFVFRYSGLPAGLNWWQRLAASLVGNVENWHQLDHYTSVVIALDAKHTPRAICLQQHNYMHTYIVGVEEAFPTGGPFAVDVAISSNELYPHRPTTTIRPAASFVSATTAPYLAGVAPKPASAAPDITNGINLVEYKLLYLPPNDAFYVFLGRLGARRRMFGRDGPPGAMFYTIPELTPLEKSMTMFYWSEPDQEFADMFKSLDEDYLAAQFKKQQQRLAAALGLI